MKIYIENLNVNIQKLLNSKDLYITNNIKNYIYTNEGIFTTVNNNIYKFNLHDDVAEYKENFIKNTHIYVDYSNTTIANQPIYHLPFPNYLHNFNEYCIKLSKDSIVSLIVRISNDNINDWFFISDETLDNLFIKNDINKLISYIN